MDASEKKLKRKLIEKRKIVKQKLDLLKQGEIAQEDIFSPITKHLKSIETKLDPSIKSHQSTETAIEEKNEDDFSYENEESNMDLVEQDNGISENIMTTPIPARRRIQFQSTPVSHIYDDDDNENVNLEGLQRSIVEEAHGQDIERAANLQANYEQTRNQKIWEESFQDYLSQYEPLPRKYIKNMIQDTRNEFDHKYGVVFNDKNEKFYLGDSQLTIVDSDIFIQGKRYKGTIGLYELLFKKHPKNFNLQDERNYTEIVLKTNAHRRYYKPSEQIQGSTLPKYKKIIAPAVRHKVGRGVNDNITTTQPFMQYSSKPIEYVHWDDPNELVDRLRLLIASQSAGNNSHTNEINSLIEELREANIIV